MTKALISIPDAAPLLGVSVATAYRMANAGQFPMIKLGGDGNLRIIRSKLFEMYGLALDENRDPAS